jgi:hypothetical protein
MAMGSFSLYLLGYLALRFHLTMLGVGTDFGVLDERYLFAGAKYLVFLVASIPIVGLLGLGLVTVVYLPYRLVVAVLPTVSAAGVRRWLAERLKKLTTWWSDPTKLAVTGIVLSILVIQLAMRQCLTFSNLLVAEKLGEPAWLHPLLVGETAGWWSLYFPGLVAVVVATGCLLWAATSQEVQTGLSRLLIGLLSFMVAVQFLFLPVNYGHLYLDTTLPRVGYLGEKQQLAQGQQAWLVWEGKEGMTYLVRQMVEGGNARSLVTLPKKDVAKTEIIGYDRILCVLFREQGCRN